MNRLNISPYSILESIEADKWNSFYKEQEIIERQREEAEKINKLFPIYLNDFNPKDPKYANYLNNEVAQEKYSDLVNAIVEHNSIRGDYD